jgi:hypothetical protein
MAIILVNLTFAEAELRNELVAPESGIELVEALAYSLRVASLSAEEYETRQHTIEVEDEEDVGDSENLQQLLLKTPPRQRLTRLMTADQQFRQTRSALAAPRNSQKGVLKYWSSSSIVDPDNELFPETARWCMSALKNLTRPCKDTLAAKQLVQTRIVPLVLEFVTISAIRSDEDRNDGLTGVKVHPSTSQAPGSPNSLGSGSYPTHDKADQLGNDVEFTNASSTWDSNSMQDAALYLVMNLAANPSSRTYLKDCGALRILSFITKYRASQMKNPDYTEDNGSTAEELSKENFQSIKAVRA